ncbi:MAG: adenine phosphoribosyltransferase [Schleiferiaceae bacterium]|nr:adenine phosphoribosyltransferase [Schleiferiaceae bacterium]
MRVDNQFKSAIRTIEDFPKPGISYKDISTLFLRPDLCKLAVATLAEHAKKARPTAIAGIESRGFLLGPAIAMALDLPFVMIRKKGKLPAETVSQQYDLEYGSATIEMHTDSIRAADRIWIHDDVLATGGTSKAAAALIEKLGAEVAGLSFIMELQFLEGRKNLQNITEHIQALVAE